LSATIEWESFGYGPDGANVWPNLINFESDIRGCWERLSNIGDTVLESLALASGIEQGFLRNQCATRELSTMRLLHYSQNSAPNLEHNVGIAAHTDFECITLILQTAPGLELRTRSGEWIDALTERGHIVVLLGDMLERWTNGKLQATGHRVRNTETQRMSIVMFLAVNDGVEVKPLPDFMNDDAPVKYETIDQRRHLAAEIAQAEIYRDESQ
jgi:isopenicillin N synthase-like dioxygenase